jgi:hypothetical protein
VIAAPSDPSVRDLGESVAQGQFRQDHQCGAPAATPRGQRKCGSVDQVGAAADQSNSTPKRQRISRTRRPARAAARSSS